MESKLKRKISLSGIQSTGVVHLGNYIGALKQWVELQEEYDCFYMIANMHAITVRQDPAALRKATLDAYALLLACGVDPERSVAFVQSDVKTHAELTWVLNCHTQFGEMSRMTQFKDKSAKNESNINVGLFTYPVLMAADILLYQADVVPVGHDQKQHVEITRDIAGRFNGLYGDIFTIPEPLIPKVGARIMSLADPEKKMSKSDDNDNSRINVLDSRDIILRKCKRAVTDSESAVAYRDGKSGISNLMSIYSAVTGNDYDAITREFAGKGYGDFKLAVGEAVADYLAPIQKRFSELCADKAYLESCRKNGADRALAFSQRTLDKAYRKVGFR